MLFRSGMLIQKGWAANPAPAIGKRHGVKATAANLLKRLDRERADVLRFATDFRAPFDNYPDVAVMPNFG